MRKLFLLFVFLSNCLLLCAQKNYAVGVTDARTGKAVSNASIKHKSSGKIDGVTNESGAVVIQGSPGDVIEVSCAGYVSQEVTLSVFIGVSVILDSPKIKYPDAILEKGKIRGIISSLNNLQGNVLTNIPAELFSNLNIKAGQLLKVSIYHNKTKVYQGNIPYLEEFTNLPKGEPFAYINDSSELSFGLNQADFSELYKVKSGIEWSVEVSE